MKKQTYASLVKGYRKWQKLALQRLNDGALLGVIHQRCAAKDMRSAGRVDVQAFPIDFVAGAETEVACALCGKNFNHDDEA